MVQVTAQRIGSHLTRIHIHILTRFNMHKSSCVGSTNVNVKDTKIYIYENYNILKQEYIIRVTFQ